MYAPGCDRLLTRQKIDTRIMGERGDLGDHSYIYERNTTVRQVNNK